MSVSDNEIYVNYGNVSNVFQTLEAATSQISNGKQQLEDNLQPLRATWSGASESQWTMVDARCQNDIANMQSSLSKANQTLSEMSTNYGNTDNNLAQQWAAI